ncbi:MAG: DUF4199 domain-containing protein [Sphingomonas sp.]
MLKKILTYGAIAGLIVSVPMCAMMVLWGDQPPLAWGMAFGYSTMLIALSTVFVAIKRHRDRVLGGVIGILPALGLGLGISLVAGVIYVLAWEATLVLTNIDFIGQYAKVLIEEKRAAGATPAELAKFAAEMEKMRVQYADPLFRMPLTFMEIFPVGLLVSLVSAGLLRFPRFLPARVNAPASAPSAGTAPPVPREG